MQEPWFARMRGIFSQIYFKNNCNRIHPDHLSVLLLADRGEKINWRLILDDQFGVQLHGHRRRPNYHSPIGPFLTQYIAKYLAYHRTHHQPLAMGTLLDVHRETALVAARDVVAPKSSKRPRLLEDAPNKGGEVRAVLEPRAAEFCDQRAKLTLCLEHMFQSVHAMEQERSARVI